MPYRFPRQRSPTVRRRDRPPTAPLGPAPRCHRSAGTGSAGRAGPGLAEECTTSSGYPSSIASGTLPARWNRTAGSAKGSLREGHIRRKRPAPGRRRSMRHLSGIKDPRCNDPGIECGGHEVVARNRGVCLRHRARCRHERRRSAGGALLLPPPPTKRRERLRAGC